jgi:DNA invertase Pin-like site-specific DNA recombinase
MSEKEGVSTSERYRRWDRPELHRLLDQLRKGDVLVVWRLDRLSRSLRDVLMIMERIQELKPDSGV